MVIRAIVTSHLTWPSHYNTAILATTLCLRNWLLVSIFWSIVCTIVNYEKCMPLRFSSPGPFIFWPCFFFLDQHRFRLRSTDFTFSNRYFLDRFWRPLITSKLQSINVIYLLAIQIQCVHQEMFLLLNLLNFNLIY